MLQGVEADVWESGASKQRLKEPVHEVVAAHGRSQLRKKDEFVVLPEPDEGLPLLKLALSVPLQGLCGLSG